MTLIRDVRLARLLGLAALGVACLDATGLRRVATLDVLAADSALLVGHTLPLQVRAWNSTGQSVSPLPLTWSSSDSSVLAVDAAGVAHATSAGPDRDIAIVARASSGVADTLILHVAVPGEVKWRLALGPTAGIGGPAQAPDGTIYVLTLDEPGNDVSTLHAVTPRGQVKWRQRLAEVRNNYPVVGQDGAAYVVGQYAYAFAPDGTLRWSVTNRPSSGAGNQPDANSAALSDNGVLYAAMGFDLFAFRAGTGDTEWVGPRSVPGAWRVPPTVSTDARTAYVKRTGDSTLALEGTTGRVRWRIPDPDTVYRLEVIGVGPVATPGVLYVPAAEQVQAADTLGEVLAVGPSYGLGVSEPAVGPDGTVYVQRPQNYGLFAYRPVDAEQWRAPAYRSRWTWYGGPALAAGGVLYAAAIDGFYALQLSASGATVRWRFPRELTDSLVFVGAPLIGADGTVYSFTSCTNGEETLPCSDELFAFWEDKPAEPNSPWPMWRHDARRSGQAHR